MRSQNPYAAPQASLGDHVDPNMPEALAGRGQRLGARVLDQFIYAVAISPGFVLVLETLDGSLTDVSTGAVAATVIAAILFVTVLGINLRLLSERGQTIGKRAIGVRIVSLDGSGISLGRIIGLRVVPIFVLGLIPMIGGLVGLSDSLFIFRDDRRCIHDLIAESKVVLAP